MRIAALCLQQVESQTWLMGRAVKLGPVKRIKEISELMHTLEIIATIEFLVEINLVGIQMTKRLKGKARKSGVVDLADLTYSKAERDRVEKSEARSARKILKLAHDEGIMIAGVMMGADGGQGENIGLSDYRKWIQSSFESPFVHRPSSAVWDYINSPSLVKKLEKTVSDGLKEGTDNITVIKQLEKQLGVDQQYPRWLRSRIFSITPPRQNKTTGLLRRPTSLRQVERSFAYNAYRLFNTEVGRSLVEIQTKFAIDNPYITKKRVILSPYHPMCDECDKVSKRIWAPSDRPLPVHPNCLCYYRAIVEQATIDRLRKSLASETGTKRSKRLERLRSLYPFAIVGIANYLLNSYDI